MVRDFNLRMLARPAALFMAAMLAGCAQTSGLGDLSLLGGTPDAAEAGSAEGQVQLATLTPEETPPVPSRRPGKRLRALATQTAQAQAPATTAATPAADSAAQPEKAEGSGISLASLGNINLFSSGGSDKVLTDQPPVQAYSLLARRIKYCWLNPVSPRLPNHGFYAELPAGAEFKEANMILFEKDKDGRRGTTVFKVDITAESDGALVSASNVRLDKTVDADFKADLARWAKGDERCKV